jgi:hypothetical protein
MAQKYVDLDRLIMKYGGRFEYWVTHRAEIAKFIKKAKVSAVEAKHLRAVPPAVARRARPPEEELPPWWPEPWPIPWPGIRAPHIHHAGDIYVLNAKQWREFSKMAIKEFQEKLAKAEEVGFAQLMEISEVMEGL